VSPFVYGCFHFTIIFLSFIYVMLCVSTPFFFMPGQYAIVSLPSPFTFNQASFLQFVVLLFCFCVE
jgi:hypothetical protein